MNPPAPPCRYAAPYCAHEDTVLVVETYDGEPVALCAHHAVCNACRQRVWHRCFVISVDAQVLCFSRLMNGRECAVECEHCSAMVHCGAERCPRCEKPTTEAAPRH